MPTLPNEGPILEVPCSIISKRGVILLGRLGPWAMGHSNHVMALGKNHPLHLIYFGVLLEFSVKSHCLWVSFKCPDLSFSGICKVMKFY
jgi:hypothetical protein